MNKKLVTVMLAIVLALGGIGIGTTFGRLMPDVGQMFSANAAEASSLSLEAAKTQPSAIPTGSGFTYQGRLKDGPNPANGSYDFEFRLYDAASGGAPIGMQFPTTQVVSEGLFNVVLDFGAFPFNGDARYLDIAVRPTGGGSFVTLSPRQPVTPAPYALYALKAKEYKNVVTVSPQGGDFTSIQAALNSITTNTSSNGFLVRVGPGVYTEKVMMKQFVDIEGSGEKNTRITFTGNESSLTGTVVGSSNAELRFLAVESTGANNSAVGIFNDNTSPSLLHITATAYGGSHDNSGVLNANGASPTMKDVTATSSGGSFNYGVYNYSALPIMTDVTATASGSGWNVGVDNENNSSPIMTHVIATASEGTTNIGVENSNSSSTMNDVTARGSFGSNNNYGVSNDQASSVSMINITATGFGGVNAVGVNNNISSPSMTGVTAEGSSGSYTFGVKNSASSPNMTNVTATGTGGLVETFGVYNEDSSSPTMTDVIAKATGGPSTTNTGVYNTFSSSPLMNNVTATGFGGTQNYGVASYSSSAPTINNSVITGSTNTIANSGRVGASSLNGGPVIGSVTCAGVYDENFAFFTNTCP